MAREGFFDAGNQQRLAAPVGLRDEVDLPLVGNVVRLVKFPLQELPCLEGNLHGKIPVRSHGHHPDVVKSGLPYLIGPLL